MADPRPDNCNPPVVSLLLPFTPALLVAAKALMDARPTIDLLLNRGTLCELTFHNPEALKETDDLIQRMALRNANAFQDVIACFDLIKESMVKPLQQLIELHRAIPVRKYPAKKYH
jgi:hypothetical protein